MKDLQKERQKRIDSASSSNKKIESKINDLNKLLHPRILECRVKEIIKETKNSKTFILERLDKSNMPPFKGGSYITLETKIDGNSYYRPYSISSSIEDKKHYRITVKKNGAKVSEHLYNRLKIDEKINIHGPYDSISYNEIRDSKDIVLIAGGSGITTLIPIVYEVLTKHYVQSLILLYGVNKKANIYYKKELDELEKKYAAFKVYYFIKDEIDEECQSGYINEYTIQSLGCLNKTYFISGPIEMYESLNKIFKKLNIKSKDIRCAYYNKRLTNTSNKVYKLTVLARDDEIKLDCKDNETILECLENNGIVIPNACRVGYCGLCKSKFIKGKIKTNSSHMRDVDKKYNYIHPCVTYITSDTTIELPF